MGKNLIIKGADFSVNAIFVDKWYNRFANLQGSLEVSVNSVICDPQAITALGLIGKPINKVKLYSRNEAPMRISVCQVTGSRESGEYSYNVDSSLSQDFTVDAGENIINLATPITLSEGQTIYFYSKGREVLTSLNDGDAVNVLSDKGFSYAYSGGWVGAAAKISIMFGYTDE